jgi:NAD(P)-dependent dehydrogenase (short-subunit alcohol dehydrogenase family)
MAKQYLIVGGSTGIGKSLSEQLTKAGHQVFVASRSAASRMESGDNISVHTVDATDESADWSFLPEKLDGVVYCGGSINLKPFHRLKNADFLEDFKVNLVGAVNTIQAALPALKKADQGSIVLFSTVAVQRGLTFHSSVSAAKGGIEGLIRALSAEFAPKIRVNAVAISLTNTPKQKLKPGMPAIRSNALENRQMQHRLQPFCSARNLPGLPVRLSVWMEACQPFKIYDKFQYFGAKQSGKAPPHHVGQFGGGF